MDPLLGEIRMFAGNFAPIDWALCNGQTLSIQQHQALFSIIGTMYGGDGVTTFRLPDLRGRTPIGAGSSSGLTPRSEGEMGGVESVTLNANQMPAHTHSVLASRTQTTNRPDGGYVAGPGAFAQSADTQLAASAIAGGSQAHANMQPFLALNFIIALEGVYPSRP
jgi:microcystin-dependent protein